MFLRSSSLGHPSPNIPRVFHRSMAARNNHATTPTAGIIVVGDEILKGYTHDTNSHYLCQRLFKLGVKVERISVIPDQVPVIASEVRKFSDAYTYVITSGGVGPTHDDMTFQAFDDRLVLNEQLETVVRAFFEKSPDTKAENIGPALKLAQVPSTAKLLWGVNKQSGKRSLYPVVQVRNVTVFPGIPRLLQRAFDMLEDEFASANVGFRSFEIFLNSDEFSIADKLTQVSEKYKDKVNIGSYPKIDHSYYRVKVVVDSADEIAAEMAHKELVTLLSDSTIPYDRYPLEDCVSKFDAYLNELRKSDPTFANRIDESIKLIDQMIDKYSCSQISLSFNGGKDCTVLLHLLHVCLLRKYGSQLSSKLNTVYFKPNSSFAELDQFTDSTAKSYQLELVTLHGKIKKCLGDLKQSHPHIELIFMGTRKSDPNSAKLETIAPTDPGWPQFLRISPIIEWNYGQIWKFLRNLWLPYCKLYDRGYTSVGCQQTTGPNEALKFVDTFGFTRYKPAHMLQDESLERHGRNS